MTLVAAGNNEIGMRPITLHRDAEVSDANTALTVTPTVGAIRRVVMVVVQYSTTVTLNVTVTLNSGAGAGWDTLLQTIALSSAAAGVWIPDNDVIIAELDVIDVLAPAGGVGETASVAVYTEVF